MTLAAIKNLIQVIRIDRVDGVSIGLSEFNNDIVIDGVTYLAQGAIDPQNQAREVNLSTDNSEVRMIIDNEVITAQALLAGLYDEAVVTVAFVDFVDLPNTLEDATIVLRGRVGEVSFQEDTFRFEVRSYSELLGKAINRKVSPYCPWSFGDSRCKFDRVANGLLLENVPITNFLLSNSALILNTTLITSNFVGGVATFTSGNNNGLRFEIGSINGNNTVLLLGELAGENFVGDTVTVAGFCAKTQQACQAYNNYVNFGGFPSNGNFLPGLSRITVIP